MLCPTLSFMDFMSQMSVLDFPILFSYGFFGWLLNPLTPLPLCSKTPAEPPHAGTGSANVALGGVSFTMGCHIEYTTLGKTMQLAPTMGMVIVPPIKMVKLGSGLLFVLSTL